MEANIMDLNFLLTECDAWLKSPLVALFLSFIIIIIISSSSSGITDYNYLTKYLDLFLYTIY